MNSSIVECQNKGTVYIAEERGLDTLFGSAADEMAKLGIRLVHIVGAQKESTPEPPDVFYVWAGDEISSAIQLTDQVLKET